MKLLALDPSSKATGYAVFDGRKILESGCARPNNKKCAEQRILEICNDVDGLIAQYEPLHIIIETPPRTPREHKRSAITLPTYGIAVGAIWRTCYLTSADECGVHCVPGDEWIGGKRPLSKRDRLMVVQSTYPTLRIGEKDHDAVDAIALGMWWLDRQKEIEHGN